MEEGALVGRCRMGGRSLIFLFRACKHHSGDVYRLKEAKEIGGRGGSL